MSTQSDWIQTEGFRNTESHPIYAISDEIVVTPEPAAIALMGPALGLVLLRRRRRTVSSCKC